MSVAPADNGSPLDKVTLESLEAEHPERVKWKAHWENFGILYKGGEELLLSAGQQVSSRSLISATTSSAITSFAVPPSQRRRFLFQLEGEPDIKYFQRWERAFYIGYFAAILDYFRHWLFSQPPQIQPADGGDVPEWFDAFSEDCTGSGLGLIDFVKNEFLPVSLYRYSGWLIGSTVEEKESALKLTPYTAKEIQDWQCSETGELEWVVLKKCNKLRQFPSAREQVEIYTYADRNMWRAWQVDDKKKLQVIGEGVHGLGQVPFVMCELPHGLWAANKLASWQVDLFNKTNMLSYSQLNSCFLQPYLKSNDSTARSRVFGDGVLLNLRLGADGNSAEEFGWAAAPTGPLEFAANALKEQRDEGYRIVHQMSLAVDSQAIGAIARSGVSKIEDRRASEIILAGLGWIVRDSLIKTLNLASAIMGTGEEWQCNGYDNFQVSSLDEELQATALISTLNIPSPTFKKELLSDIATGRVLGHVDESVKTKIREEISDAVDEEEANKEQMVNPSMQAAEDMQPRGVKPAPDAYAKEEEPSMVASNEA